MRPRVDGLIEAGCYRCLTEALENLPPGASFEARRFQLLVLAAARVRELGLAGEPDWLAQARELAGASPTVWQQLLIDLPLPRSCRAARAHRCPPGASPSD